MPARSFHRAISAPASTSTTMELPPAYAPQALSDILPIYCPSDADDHIRTFSLRQTSPSTQVLSLVGGDNLPSIPDHVIKSHKTGGFMNRKPHLIITNSNCSDKAPVVEARFDIHGTGTTITYPNRSDHSRCQRLELEDSRTQTIRTSVGDSEGRAWWQPCPGNRDVLELTRLADGMEEILARFVHTKAQSSSRKASVTSLKTKFVEEDVGELHIVDALVESEKERCDILCSALVVVERARRRAAILDRKSSPYGVMGTLSSTSAGYIPQ